MTYYDVAMACVVIAGLVWGAWRGITWQIASIASLVLGYTASHTLSGQLAPQMPGEPVVARGIAMIVIYVAVSGGVFLAAWLVRTTLRKMQFEAFDRHLGMLLGGLEGALLGMVATLFVVSVAPQTRTPIFSSPTGRMVGQVMATLGPVLPEQLRTALTPFWNGAAPESDTLAGEPAFPAPAQPEPSRPASRDATGTQAPGQTGTTSIADLIEQEESKISRAIVDTARKEIQQQIGTGGVDGRAVERR